MSTSRTSRETTKASPPPPFWRLLVADFQRQLSHVLLLAIILGVLGLLGLARYWVIGFSEALGQDLAVTLVLPDTAGEAERQAVATALAAREEVSGLDEFGPEDARQRLAEAGIDVSGLEPFAFQSQPRGFTFRWRGIVAHLEEFDRFAQSLARQHGAALHFDRARAEAQRSDVDAMLGFLGRLRLWGSVIVMVACAGIALALGRPALSVPLGTGEMAQALAVRAVAAALLGWIVAGGLLHLIALRLGVGGWAQTSFSLIWIIPVALVVSPLGLLGRTRGEAG